VEAGANAPPKSRLQVTFGGCENDRLRINHTMHMPAKVGPKRDRALARAGCYFDGSAATCGAGCVLDLRERGGCVRGIEIIIVACARVQYAPRPLHVIASEAKQSTLSLRRRNGLLRFARNDGGYSFAISQRCSPGEISVLAQRLRTAIGGPNGLPVLRSVASTPLADVNIDIEIDIADAGLRRLMRAALMPATGARACLVDVGQLQASPLRQRP
jgi:hypothetical protein